MTVTELTPRQIVAELDRYIIGQADAKKSVAVAIRNRWRRQQLAEELRQDVTPKNIIMIGPTGVGKTEIARRLAQLVGAPFIKVEASKYTEVGYHGRDVESMVRDLTDIAVGMVQREQRVLVETDAKKRVTERLLDLLVPPPDFWDESEDEEEQKRHERTREKMRKRLEAGELEDREVELNVEQKAVPVQIFSNLGMEQMDVDFQNMFERIMPKQNQNRQMPIREARKVLLEQESEALIDRQVVSEKAVELVENHGIIFLDELDKICGPDEGSSHGPDVSRQGVQRDLLPIVEGTSVNTRHGSVRSDHILFIAAGAFHVSSPSDLMPEMQGRFPIRVELTDLKREDFLRILVEPKHSLIKQYSWLLEIEGVKLHFTEDGIQAIADTAYEVNRTTQNIGARRLHTILEHVVVDVSFDGPDLKDKNVNVDAKFVKDRLKDIVEQEEVSKFIL